MTTTAATYPDIASATAPPGPDNPVPGAGAPLDDVLGEPAERQSFLHLDIEGTEVWLRLDGFSLAFTADPDGPPVASQVDVAFGPSSLDPAILEALTRGTAFRTAQIESYVVADGENRLVEEYRFDDVVLDGFHTSAGTDRLEEHELTFSFERVQHGFITYDETGVADPQSSFTWDFGLDREVKARTMLADAPLSDPELIQGEGNELSWFMRLGSGGDWIELGHVSFGVEMTGAARARAVAEPLEIAIGSDAVGPDLLEALASGERFGRLELEAYRMGAEPVLVADYRFGLAEVTDLAIAGSASLQHQVSFSYATMSSALVTQDATGQAPAVDLRGFDFRTGETFDPTYEVEANAPLDARDTIGGVPTSPLVHFMKVDGIDSWIQLTALNLAFSREAAAGGTGQSRERAVAEPAEVVFGTDSMSPELLGNLLKGRIVAGVEIEAYRLGDAEAQLVDEYELGEVVFTDLESSAGPFGLQTLEMRFDSIEHTHLSYGQDGRVSDVNRKGFDFSAGTPLASAGAADELLF